MSSGQQTFLRMIWKNELEQKDPRPLEHKTICFKCKKDKTDFGNNKRYCKCAFQKWLDNKDLNELFRNYHVN